MNRKNFKENWPMMIGAIGMFVYYGVGHFVALPDALRGFLMGLTVASLILGAVVAKVGFKGLRDWKRGLFHRAK